jgi:hypothetical protein
MPRVSFPVGWSSLRTTETSAPRATSLRFRPSIRLAPLTAPAKTSLGLSITTIMAGGLAQSNNLRPSRSIHVGQSRRVAPCANRRENPDHGVFISWGIGVHGDAGAPPLLSYTCLLRLQDEFLQHQEKQIHLRCPLGILVAGLSILIVRRDPEVEYLLNLLFQPVSKGRGRVRSL